MRYKTPLAAAVCTVALAGCGSSGTDVIAVPGPAVTVTVTASPSVWRACDLLLLWEKGKQTRLLWQDPVRFKIEAAAGFTPMGYAFAAWMYDLSLGDTTDAGAAADNVEADCEDAGVDPGVGF